MNLEEQLKVAYSVIAELKDQNSEMTNMIWSLQERERLNAESREELKQFYENQMENLRKEQQAMIDEAVERISKEFKEQISKLIAERDAALLKVKQGRGKLFGRRSERNAGHKDDAENGGTSGE